MFGKKWNDGELDLMRQMYADNYTIDVCKALNRSYSSVAGQALKMGLYKSETFVAMEREKTADRLRRIGVAGRYQKGQTAHNKGQKMATDTYEKVSRTMWKKGNVPANTNYDGHERINKDGYVMVRIRAGKYVLKHRYIWEQAHGPVPKGMILAFRDGNKLHITIENLELITRREGMERNTIHRFPPELVSTIRLVNKLNKQIHEKQN